ncbi:MAG: hypothetical protein IT320_03620 [Anaerolineae bacterium]|nr:hypothetical protein [Anaerolineae bacterium]
MEAPAHLAVLSVNAQDAQQAVEPLRRRQALEMKRMQIAAAWSLIAFAFAFIVSLIFFRGEANIPMFVSFPEWEPLTTETSALAVGVPTQVGISLERLRDAFTAFLRSGSSYQIAAAARLLSCFVIFAIIVITYRKLLLEHYEVHERYAQYDEFKRASQTMFHRFSRFFVALASMITNYVLFSVMWIILSVIFKEFTALYFAAAAFSALAVAVSTFVFVYWSLVVTTRHLVALGVFTLIIGLAATFALANPENGQQWWQAAISRAGADPRVSWLFTATLGSVFVIFVLLWVDVDNFVRLITAQAEAYHAEALAADSRTGLWARIQRWAKGHTYHIFRALYFIALFGLLGTGFVRTDPRNIDTIIAHTGGATSAIIIFNVVGLFFASWYPDPILGQPFKRISLILVGTGIISVVLFAIGVLNLTGIELICLLIIGFWLYLALENLLIYVNTLAVSARAAAAQTVAGAEVAATP